MQSDRGEIEVYLCQDEEGNNVSPFGGCPTPGGGDGEHSTKQEIKVEPGTATAAMRHPSTCSSTTATEDGDTTDGEDLAVPLEPAAAALMPSPPKRLDIGKLLFDHLSQLLRIS